VDKYVRKTATAKIMAVIREDDVWPKRVARNLGMEAVTVNVTNNILAKR
jgi:hypothetical protein